MLLGTDWQNKRRVINQDTKQEFVFSSAAAMVPHPDKVHSFSDTSSTLQEVQILWCYKKLWILIVNFREFTVIRSKHLVSGLSIQLPYNIVNVNAG